MYFVTTKRAGYLLFCTTPSECAAVGLTETQRVQLLARSAVASEWEVLADWDCRDCSHTDFMAGLHAVAEPADPRELLGRVPAPPQGPRPA